MSNFLELYEPLDIIGNGSFGIIRKVRRKTDGTIFARKELNFERMSERDRKQIVAEVNILKDLDHEHIVRYHDRHVDRDGGILYILMEYCGGGDLSSIIKQAQKHNRFVPEDTVWHYFMQILLALQHCHHPPSQSKDDRRPQILHRDLKPDNVFLDESNNVKLGDFGLSKALAQASFANTYVGTPYYMSPELMQEKAYDSKSDIWSLGCLIYELCALKPPFHEAKTHAELSIFIRQVLCFIHGARQYWLDLDRNGRIPPLPRGYSQALSSVIKAMLNLNPAMRPSATQLLQHERLVLISKVVEAEKMLATVKTHKSSVVAKERELSAREATLAEREARLTALVAEKDAEILRLHQLISTAESRVDVRIREAIGKREEELRLAVMKREQEVAAAMARREEEIMNAVRQREREIFEAWSAREEQIRAESNSAVEEKMKQIAAREADLEAEQTRLDAVQKELEVKLAVLSNQEAKGRKENTPLDEVKHLLAPLVQITEEHSRIREKRQSRDWKSVETPINRNSGRVSECMPSAMKGVILTQTGQPLATPTPTELASLFVNSPKVGLDFAKIFDFDSETEDDGEPEEETLPPSPSKRERHSSESSQGSSSTTGEPSSVVTTAPPTRLRKPSIRTSYRPPLRKTSTIPTSSSDLTGFNSLSAGTAVVGVAKSTSSIKTDHGVSSSKPAPAIIAHAAGYDLSDEENLPSPFLKRVERERIEAFKTGTTRPKRPSTGNLLRAVAAANAASARPASAGKGSIKLPSSVVGRTSTASFRKAAGERTKGLSQS
ncbi:kinase-like domain-containing protein [Pisolithus marmoratus]|nr:kinase-like domain-containing protein [Pisolithus marmoratus]